MTIAIKHAFVSLKGDGTDATQVQPSNWNAAHSITLASGQLIGRLSAGAGAAEEIPVSSYMANLLAAADAATLAGLIGLFETGDVKYTFKTTASAGWMLVGSQGSIGNAVSGASLRANADTFNLFSLLYSALPDTLAPVSGGRTGNALNDFNANKTMTIPSLVGRSPIAAGSAGFNTSARVLGTLYGEENHGLVAAELPSISSMGNITVTATGYIPMGSFASLIQQLNLSGPGGGAAWLPFKNENSWQSISSITGNNQTMTSTNTQGGSTGAGHNTLHPVVALNIQVKL